MPAREEFCLGSVAGEGEGKKGPSSEAGKYSALVRGSSVANWKKNRGGTSSAGPSAIRRIKSTNGTEAFHTQNDPAGGNSGGDYQRGAEKSVPLRIRRERVTKD